MTRIVQPRPFTGKPVLALVSKRRKRRRDTQQSRRDDAACVFAHGRKRLLADVTVLAYADHLLQRLDCATRAGIQSEIEYSVVEHGPQQIAPTPPPGRSAGRCPRPPPGS